MVKPDFDRDYYADLELPSSAEVAEVKKQFKKLALKYHPDRNPGKEDEAKEKFLVIQAAHEILTDTAQKAKYDAYRIRTARFGAAAGVRGNPYMFTSQDVNSRFGAPPTRRPPMPTRPVPTTNPSTSGASRYQNWTPKPKSKTEAFRAKSEAWDRSRASTNQDSSRTNRNGGVPPTPPRSAAQARRQEASFGAKKAGFAPTSPVGDEPPVKSHHYNTYGGFAEATSSSTEQNKPRPKSDFIDPLSQQFRETFLDNRQRTPYATNVGEKTNPHEPLNNVNRAKSMKDNERRHPDQTAPAPPPRQRSASVDSEGLRKTTSDTNPFNPANQNPRPQYTSKASARYSPRTAQSPTPDFTPAFGAAAAAAGFGAATAAFGGANSSASSVNSTANATVNGDATQANGSPKVFNVPTDDDPTSPVQQPRFTRHSADNINTQFTNEEKGNFEFSAGTESSGDDFSRARNKFRGRQSPLRNEFTTRDSGTGFPQPDQAPVPPKSSAFDARQWKEHIGPELFEPKPQTRKSVSPTRRPIKKPKSVRMTAGTAGVADEGSSSGEDRAQSAGPNINGSRSPNAMDIDPPQPEHVEQPQPVANEPRNIPVEPTKPEWRAGNGVANPIVSPAGGGAPLDPTPSGGLKTPKLNPNSAGSEDTEEFMRPMFGEFKNVEPFSQKASGLNSFADLSQNLPFQSRPSARAPIAHEKPAPLMCPPVPQPPKASPGLTMTAARFNSPVWNTYAQEFQAYLIKWADWDRQMLSHFSARQVQHERAGFAWVVSGTGDSQAEKDYMIAQELDKPIRQKWLAAYDAHEIHVKQFQQLREGLMRERR